ncbi:hypothetical protein SAMN04489718_2687 [Actinopolyspora saharensis]|uniref:Uncharacterized protein n=1 Tax=Actinopolyspora saharensis TaxID=995062 RepID=A0A1H1ETW7_9ACTN|nr:hypothetical protein SAMN04489718_2687 [Actinopolyspora saharensis]
MLSDSSEERTAGAKSGELRECARSSADPFGTAELRAAVLDSWRDSPTRFREDANAEEDLRLGGYRNRLLVELAQNAADAATAAGTTGRLVVTLRDGELRAANTGVPLDRGGVAGLAALRASPKRTENSVGRFGVGFAAVLAVTDAPRLVSTTGSVAFSAAETREEIEELTSSDGGTSAAARELLARTGEVPVLRLLWPVEEAPPEGFDTEVRLPLLPEVGGEELLDAMAEQAADLLLALPALEEIRVGRRSYSRAELDSGRVAVRSPEGERTWLLRWDSGEWPESTLTGLGVEQRARDGWWVCWAVELDADGNVAPLSRDVLHAPTPTEERLSLPARLLAGVPLEPDRRRASSSPATGLVLDRAARAYSELVTAVAPADRISLVPAPELPLSDTDERLRETILEELGEVEWLPAADGSAVTPRRATALDFHSPELVELLSDVVPGLLIAELSGQAHRRALRSLDVARMGAAELVRAVTGLQRPARWWRRLYDALAPVEQQDRAARDEFAALPVPLADGRTATGVREVLLPGGSDGAESAAALVRADVTGLRVAEPEAAHPMLERLGSRYAGADELLDTPALVEAVHNSVSDARSGTDPGPLAEAVFSLVESAGGRDWLGALALRDSDGEIRRADELLVPGAALLDVLDSGAVGAEAPLGVLEAATAERWPGWVLRSAGLLDSFAVVTEEEPDSPHEGLADTAEWWQEAERARGAEWPPARFVGVRDLDLVAGDRWPTALEMLCSEPTTLEALRDPGGYTSWWVSRYARLGGRPPRHWRSPEAEWLAGLYDPAPGTGLEDWQLRLAGVRTELDVSDGGDAEDLMHRLADAQRTVGAGVALRAHRVLAEAVACERFDPAEVDPPQAVRSVTGAVVTADRAVVLDEPWLIGVFEPALLVAGGTPEEFDAESLAELLDLPLASEQGVLEVLGQGVAQSWGDVARVPAACELLGVRVPYGQVVLRDGLRVRTAEGEHDVHWWVDGNGVVYSERSPDGLARALAWVTDRWDLRFAFAGLLAEATAVTLLR